MKFYYEPVNLKQWNMFENVKNVGHKEPFLATKSMMPGDVILLHVGTQVLNVESGVYAWGTIISKPFILRDDDRKKDYCYNKLSVWVQIERIDRDYPFIRKQDCKVIFGNAFRTVHIIDKKFESYIKSVL